MSVTLVMALGVGILGTWWCGRVLVHVGRHAAVLSARKRVAGLTEVVQAWQAVNRDEVAVFDERLGSMEASLDVTERLSRTHRLRFASLERAVRADPRWRPAVGAVDRARPRSPGSGRDEAPVARASEGRDRGFSESG